MKLTRQEADLLKQALLYYGSKYGLHGVPEYESTLQKVTTLQAKEAISRVQ